MLEGVGYGTDYVVLLDGGHGLPVRILGFALYVCRMADGSSRWPHWKELLSGDGAVNSPADLWRWWESRRLRYNLLVGIVGFATWWFVLIAGSAAVKPGVDFEEPFAMILGPPVYAVMANIFYTFGFLGNLVTDDRKPGRFLFRSGLFFSLALTALPGVWALYCWVHSVVTGQKMD